MRRFPDRFTPNFDENKHTVAMLLHGATVKVRNQIAGYITRTMALAQTEEEIVEGEQTE